MQTVNVNGGSIGLSSLISGEDQAMNWIYTASGANVYQNFRALSLSDTGTFPVNYSSNGLGIGLSGQVGDYLERIVATVPVTGTNARILLSDVSSTTYSNSASGTTAWVSDTKVKFAMGSSLLPSVIGQHLICTATFGAVTAAIARKITLVDNLTTPGTAAQSTVDITVEAMTTGGVASSGITAGTTALRVYIAPLWEVLPANAPAGPYSIQLGVKSKNGGWRVFIDSGVTPTFIGRFI